MSDKQMHTTKEIGVMFGLKGSYLRKLRQLRKGPKYLKLGTMIRYHKDDVEDWLQKAAIEIQPKSVV